MDNFDNKCIFNIGDITLYTIFVAIKKTIIMQKRLIFNNNAGEIVWNTIFCNTYNDFLKM